MTHVFRSPLFRRCSIAAFVLTTSLAACAAPMTGSTATDAPHATRRGGPNDARLGPFYAVVIEDTWTPMDTGCNSPGAKAEGADIDAVGVEDARGTTVTYARKGHVRLGDANCGYPNQHNALVDVFGTPDATRNNGYLSLWGGVLGVEIGAGKQALRPGDVLKVHEVGSELCTGCADERYRVYLAEEAECATRDDWRECAVLVATRSGTSEIMIPLWVVTPEEVAAR